MSEHITHYAVCDDCLRLMSRMAEIHPALQAAARDHRDIARLGSVTRSTDSFNPQLLQRLRDGWESRRPEENLEKKLAYSLGTLLHRAADRTMKPVFRDLGAGDAQDPTDVSVYHDVFLFREVYQGGTELPYSPTMFGEETAFEETFRVLVQRALLAMHTFIPDRTDPEGWLDRLFRLRQDFYVEIKRYAQAYHSPDPAKYQAYIVDAGFYDPEDALIRLARAIQNGETVPDGAVTAAVDTAAPRTQYAQALQRGMGYLRAANRFFGREISLEEAKTAWNIGVPDH